MEIQRIIAEVERRLSVIAATEQAIAANLSRAERLRQAILHRAFTGQLIPPP
jgi:type I restriction enzyme S subunit